MGLVRFSLFHSVVPDQHGTYYLQIITDPAHPLESHVFVLQDGYAYDADSYLCNQSAGRSAFPVQEYLMATFPLQAEKSPPALQTVLPWFRVVPAQDILNHFASDRRHMRDGKDGP